MRSSSLNLLRSAARCNRSRLVSCRTARYGLRWSSSSERQWSTPLAKALSEAITTTGPISVASYMRQCLTSPDGGYYTRQTEDHDQFGSKGDFVTSPEISQIFGELIGIWLYTEWLAQGKRKEVDVIEVGPGRGTLMADILRTVATFKEFASSVESVYLIEASPNLREKQAKLLSGDVELQELHNDFRPSDWTAPCQFLPEVNVVYCEDMKAVPRTDDTTPFIIAHEFFDALPVHVFQNKASSSIPASSTILTPTGPITPKHGPQAPKNQWHELVVSPVSKYATKTNISKSKEEDVEFQLTVSKSPTPHSLYLPQTSPRYKALEKTPDAIIEVSPESLKYISDFAVRIGGSNPPSSMPKPPPSSAALSTSQDIAHFSKSQPSGAALILDYGPLQTIPANTLRGIRSHRPISPFASPGLVDLSADVDFLALAETALNVSPGVEVHGPVEQAFFLSTMGIKERAEKLIRSAKAANGNEKVAEETIKRLETGWKRLVDRGPTGMGRIYKAMAIVPYNEKVVRRPVGFGGDVVG
ncbi:S-adenosyl-L-methionine-dependent methyltransferase [Lophiotrema nucula]|uniref:Protein arginine methyltransferase NDUFAF7 n=1 Tax=Lophiotrema nucula TaxID=690887 RepID=A0A6A5ZBP0_9PLEO|nr:S-adenosyl-L-methionine-dependent methyltransferase [Lophiotrema nucula]